MDNVKVAIIGAGPAGVGAAVRLAKLGIGPIALIEREPRVGGIPARYTSDDVPTYVMWTQGNVVPGHRFAERLRKEVENANLTVHLESMVTQIDAQEGVLTIVSPTRGQWQLKADVILVATGARESSRAERGWIYGHRPAGVLFTSNVLDLGGGKSSGDAAILGSEVMGYAAAAKLAKSGAKRVTVSDDSAHPRSLLPKRMFFYRWAMPKWMGGAKSAIIRGSRRVENLEIDDRQRIHAREVVITGSLVPNSELLAEAGLPIDTKTRLALDVANYRLDNAPIFLAGNVLGLSCSGMWAYWTGKWAAGRVARHLRTL